MKNLIANFPEQLKEAIKIGTVGKTTPSTNKIKNVVISGLGGSGIGGTIVSELTALDAKVPIVVSKGYFIPHFVNENTLFIACSYSGNTEETISALELAIEKEAKVICVTSGGKIAEMALKNKFDLIVIPGGMPPRSCLGYSMVQLLFILSKQSLISYKFASELEKAIALIEREKKAIELEANTIAEKLINKIPIIYSTTYKEGIAIRFRQQLNENSKMLCWHHVIPEMNHNELVGWRDKNEQLAVVLLRDENEYERNETRFEITKEIVKKYTNTTIEIFAKGESEIEKSIYLIHLVDWISYFIAEKKGIDATEVKVIDFLKSELAKV